MKIYKKDLPYILLLLFLVIVFFRKAIFSKGVILSNFSCDINLFFFDCRYYGFRMLAKGIVPLWNPYNFGGTPFIAGIQSAVFYPLNFIFLIFPTSLAINYSIILHIFLSGLFFYCFIQYLGVERFSALISSVIFMFSASQVCRIYAGHLTIICAIAWLPLALLFLEKCIRGKSIFYALLTGVVLALQILAGHAQYFFYSLIAVFLFFIFRTVIIFQRNKNLKEVVRLSALFLLLIIVGLSLSAVQTLPSFEFLEHSLRKEVSYQFCSQFSFPPENLITFLIPNFFGNTFRNYWGRWYPWEVCAYLGIFPLILSIIALRFKRNKFTLFFLGLAFLSLILSFGKYTPLFKILYNFMPGFNRFRGPTKFIFLTTFSLAVLSGFGSNFLFTQIRDKQKRGLLKLSWVLVVLAISILTAVIITLMAKDNLIFWKNLLGRNFSLGSRYWPLLNLEDPDILRNTFLISFKGTIKFAALLITSTILILLWAKNRIKLSIFKTLVLTLIIVDLGIFGAQWIVTFDAQQRDWKEDVVKFLKKDQGLYRVITPDSAQGLNLGMVYRVANIGGYDVNILRRYQEFINFSQGYPLNYPNLHMEIKKYSPLLNLLNLKYVILHSKMLAGHSGFELVFSDDQINIYQNRDCLPRAFIVHKAKVIKGRENIFRALGSKNFNPREYVILEKEIKLETGNRPLSIKEPTPQIIKYSPNEVIVKTKLLQDGFLLLSDTYYPGWKAFIDSRETEIYRADYILRAVYLTKGKHTVHFVYQPLSFKIGGFITLVSLGCVLGIIGWSFFRNRRI